MFIHLDEQNYHLEFKEVWMRSGTLILIVQISGHGLPFTYILNAKKPAPGKYIKIYEKNGNVKI